MRMRWKDCSLWCDFTCKWSNMVCLPLTFLSTAPFHIGMQAAESGWVDGWRQRRTQQTRIHWAHSNEWEMAQIAHEAQIRQPDLMHAESKKKIKTIFAYIYTYTQRHKIHRPGSHMGIPNIFRCEDFRQSSVHPFKRNLFNALHLLHNLVSRSYSLRFAVASARLFAPHVARFWLALRIIWSVKPDFKTQTLKI